MNYDRYDYLVKLVLIGDNFVGKTSLCNILTKNRIPKVIKPTFGVDFFSILLNINEKVYKIQFWDTAGHEKFKFIIKPYLKGTQISFILFDLSNKKSFNSLEKWINQLIEIVDNVGFVLVGNKSDLINEVSDNDIEIIKKKYNLDYIEISAKYNINIDLLKNKIVDLVKNKKYNNVINRHINDKTKLLENFLVDSKNAEKKNRDCIDCCSIF